MKNKTKQPCIFFENLLEDDKTNELRKKFISDFIEDFKTFEIENIDKEKGIISINDVTHDEVTNKFIPEISVYTFEDDFNLRIEENFQKAKSKIDEMILEAILKDKNPKRFIDNQILLLNDLLPKVRILYLDRPVVKKSIVRLIKFLRKRKTYHDVINTSAPNLVEIDNFSPYSFNWDSANSEDTIPNLEKFYFLITISPPLIECSKEDFINAFTKRKISDGIKWLVKGDNKQISKSSLLYFVSRLIEEGLIVEIETKVFNKTIEYLFRDSFGEILKNIKQTKSTSSVNPAQKNRIDSIINSIFSEFSPF
jgi:hypothetical protein